MPDNQDFCLVCGVEIPPGPDFCSNECEQQRGRMQRLTKEQRDKVLAMWREGMRTSRIATLLGLTRERVRNYVKYLNAHPEFK